MKKFLALLPFLGFSLFWACHLGPEADKNTFDVAGDTAWTRCDTLEVTLHDSAGEEIDVLFEGKLKSLSELADLDAEKYPGGAGSIHIFGKYQDGSVCVDQTRRFEDGGSKVKVDTLVDPSALPDSVVGDPLHLSLVADGEPGTVRGKVFPSYVDQGIYWALDNAGVASLSVGPDTPVGEVKVKPEALGEGYLILSSRKNPDKTSRVRVRVSAAAATAVALDNDSLTLYAGGSKETLKAVVSPFLADPAVTWSSTQPAIVSVDSGGVLTPLKPGAAWVKAVTGNGLADSARIVVLADVPVLTVTSRPGAHINETLTFSLRSVQKVGTLVHFAWDIAGDGTWDDSLPGPWLGETVDLPEVSGRFSTEGLHHPRFRVRDSEGNVATAEATVDIGNQAPEFLALRADTAISIQDSIPMTALVRDLDGGVAWAGWDYEGDGLFDDTLTAADSLLEVVLGHRYQEAGNYLAVFKAIDGNGKARMDTAKVKVEFDAPVADAGRDTTVIVNSEIDLHLNGSDGYGRIMKRELKAGDGAFVTVSKADTSIPAPAAPTEITYVLRVTDDDGLTDTDTVKVSVVLSANADLSALTLSAGTLAPAFSPGIGAYTAQVAFADSQVRITPTASVATASITVNGNANSSGIASLPVKLDVGPNANAFTVVVSSPDGSIRSYAVSVTRQPSAEATLKALTGTGFTLRPAFASNVLDYLDTVAQAVTSITLRPTTTLNTATVTVNGTAIASGTPTAALPLVPGDNLFTLVVTAQDGATKTTYKVKIVRRAKLYIYRKLGAAAPVLSDSAEFPPGVSRPISSPGATGYAFGRWSLTEGNAAFADSAANPTSVTLNSALVRAQASFTLNRYAIDASSKGCGDITPAPGRGTYDHGTNVLFTLAPRTDCRIASVKVDGNETPSAYGGTYTFGNLSAPHAIAVVFVRTYALSGKAGSGGAITPSAAIRVDSGSTPTVVISPDNGKKVFSLKDNGNPVSPTTHYTLPAVQADHHVEATFAGGFTLTGAVTLGAGTITPASIGVDSGSSQTFTFKPAANYRYLGLLDNGKAAVGVVGDTQYTVIAVDTAHALQVRFLRRFPITVVPVGCGTVSPGSQAAVDSGTSHTFNFTPVSGCKVDSVFVNTASVPPAASHTVGPVTAQTTLRVVFTRVFTIGTTWGTSGDNRVGGSVSPANPSVDSLDTQAFTIAALSGYRRSAVSVNGIPITPPPSSYTFPPVTQAGRTLHATFTRTFVQSGSVGLGQGAITPLNATVDTNGSQTFTFNPANSDYRFHSMLLNGNEVTPNGGTTGHTLSGISRENTVQVRYWRLYPVSVTASGCGTVTPGGGMVDSNSTPRYDFTLPSGCSVDSLIVDGVPRTLASSVTLSPVLSNRSIRVVFSQGYTVTTLWGTSGNNHVGGSLSPENPGVVSGQTVTLTNNVLPGYRRESFTFGTTSVIPAPATYTTPAITGNVTVQATYVRTFTHSGSVYWGQGTLTPASVTLDTGASQTFTYAPANANYRFDTLKVNGTPVTPNPGNGQHTVSGTRDNVVTVRFRRLYNVTVASTGCGSVSPGTGLRDSNSTPQYTFTPLTGCKVDSVFVGNSPVALGASYTFPPLTAERTLRVVFTRQYTVATTWSVNGTFQVGGSVSPLNPLVDSLDPVTLAINPGTGYRRLSLVVNNGQAIAPQATYTFPSVVGNQSLHANFLRIYRITGQVLGQPGGTVTPAENWVDTGSAAEVVITPDPGWRIDTIRDNKNVVVTGGTAAYFHNIGGIKEDHDVTARFLKVWDLKVGIKGEGKADPESGYMDDKADQTVKFQAAQGWYLAQLMDGINDVTSKLTGDPAGASAYVIERVGESHTLEAVFRQREVNGFRLRILNSLVLKRGETAGKAPELCARWESNQGSGQQCAAGELVVTIPPTAKVEIGAASDANYCVDNVCNGTKKFTYWSFLADGQQRTDASNPLSFSMEADHEFTATYGAGRGGIEIPPIDILPPVIGQEQ